MLKTGSELSNTTYTLAESLQLEISIMHQSMCIFKAGLSISLRNLLFQHSG